MVQASLETSSWVAINHALYFLKNRPSDCQSVLILVNGKLVMRRDDLKCKVCRIKQQCQNFVHESVCFSKDFYLILVEKKRRDDLSSRKSPRITKNINGYTKRMSLQKGKKKQASQTPGLKREFTKKCCIKIPCKSEGGRAGAKRRGQVRTTDFRISFSLLHRFKSLLVVFPIQKLKSIKDGQWSQFFKLNYLSSFNVE